MCIVANGQKKNVLTNNMRNVALPPATMLFSFLTDIELAVRVAFCFVVTWQQTV